MQIGYNLSAGREPAQIAKMEELIRQGLCAFCPEQFKEYHDNPIEFKTRHWVVTKNDYPYENTALHLLIIAKEHVRFAHELSTAAKAEFLDVIAKIEKEFALPSLSVGLRLGDFRFNGGSVDHIHAHIFVGPQASDNNEFEPVRMKMTSLPRPISQAE